MRSFGITRVFAAAILALAAASSSYAGVVLNSGFEDGNTTPWTFHNGSAGFYSGSPWAADVAAAHSGIYGAKADGNWGIKQMFAGVPVSDIASVTFWLRRPTANLADNGQIQILMDLYYSDSTSGWWYTTLTTNDWVKFDATSALNPAKTLVGIDTYGFLSCSAMTSAQCAALGPWITYVDDFNVALKSELSPVPEPAAF